VLERLEQVAGLEVEVIHVIGGGSQNELLCQLTATLVGRPVLAGPVEATALGNVLVQARATSELGPLAELRSVVAQSTELRTFEPGSTRSRADDDYRRFLNVTGLTLEPHDQHDRVSTGAMT
jgi:rhamnulokinase